MTGKNWDFQKIITLVLNVLELHPWSGFEEEAQDFSYKLLSLSLNDPSGIYMESTAQLLKMVKNTGHYIFQTLPDFSQMVTFPPYLFLL